MIRQKKAEDSGLISLEACIVVPIFMMLMMFMYGFILIFMGQQAISHALLQSTQSLALDSFATEQLELTDIEDGADLLVLLYAGLFTSHNPYFSATDQWYSGEGSAMTETIRKRFIGYFAGTEAEADAALKAFGIVGGKDGLDFGGSTVTDGKLYVHLTYRQKLLFDFNGHNTYSRELTAQAKLWGNLD